MARPKKINLRVEGGWHDERVSNKAPYHCDIDGSRLYVAPDGKTVYCDKVHTKEEIDGTAPTNK